MRGSQHTLICLTIEIPVPNNIIFVSPKWFTFFCNMNNKSLDVNLNHICIQMCRS